LQLKRYFWNQMQRIMNKHIRILLLITAFFFTSRASGQLSIVAITGYIDSTFNDTATDATGYGGLYYIVNTDTTTIVDTIDVFLRANSHSVYNLSNSTTYDSLAPGDTVVKNLTVQFDPIHFDDGDNIVVIWPAARNSPPPYDTMTTHIYYDQSIGVNELSQLPVTVYPNPASEYLVLGGLNGIKLKRVRILDSCGKEYYSGIPFAGMIPIGRLAKGNYIVHVEGMDGRVRTVQVIKD
jgi:hypothetical protein